MPDEVKNSALTASRVLDCLDMLPHGVCVMSPRLELMAANRAFSGIMGYPKALLRPGTSLLDFIRFDCDRGMYGDATPDALFRAMLQEVIDIPEVCAEIRLPNGCFVEFRRNTMPDGMSVCTFTNVTDRRRHAERLRQSSTVIRHLPDAVAVTDLNLRILEHNPAFCRLFGYAGGSADGLHLPPSGFLSTPAAEAIFEAMDEAITAGGHFRFDATLRRKDGSQFDVEAGIWPRSNTDGEPSGYVALFRNVTEEIERQRRLERQDRVIAQLSEAVIVADDEGRVIDCNDAARTMYGYSLADLKGRAVLSVLRVVPMPGEPETAEIVEQVRHAGQWRGELSLRTRDGRTVISECNVRRYYDEFDNAAGMIGVHRDITARRAADDALRRQALIIEHMREAAAVTDAAGTILELNVGARRIFGCTSAGGVREDFARQLAEIAKSAGEHGYFEGSYALGNANAPDSMIICDSVAVRVDTPGRDTGRAPPHIVSVHRDITERVRQEQRQSRLEERLARWQRLETLGRMAGGIAHDFNNILTPVFAHARLAGERLAPDHPAQTSLDKILRGVEKARELASEILTFGQRTGEPQQLLLLDAAIAEALDLLNDDPGPGVELVRDLAAGDTRIAGNAGLLQRLVNNLCRNAIAALQREPDGRPAGRLRVATECLASGKRGSAPQVRLTIEDNGCGIARENLERIFDPFFTTRPDGIGLGLAVVHGVVASHGGSIHVESKPGEGTRFEILFPVAAPPDRKREDIR